MSVNWCSFLATEYTVSLILRLTVVEMKYFALTGSLVGKAQRKQAVEHDRKWRMIVALNTIFSSSFFVSRDRLVVRTLRCGRSNPGSNPGPGTIFLSLFFFLFLFLKWIFNFVIILFSQISHLSMFSFNEISFRYVIETSRPLNCPSDINPNYHVTLSLFFWRIDCNSNLS